ncbi:hypothetical protein ACV3SS_13000, partial [Clostridium perfringens]
KIDRSPSGIYLFLCYAKAMKKFWQFFNTPFYLQIFSYSFYLNPSIQKLSYGEFFVNMNFVS